MKNSIDERLARLESVVFSGDERTAATAPRRALVTPSRAERHSSSVVVAKLAELQQEQRSLTAVLEETHALLNFSRTYEKRLERLETAVFGKPQ